MLFNLMICALSLGTPTSEITEQRAVECNEISLTEQEFKKKESEEESWTMDPKKEKFWAKRKALRLGYEVHQFQTMAGEGIPQKFGVGLSYPRSVWFHKKPIGGFMKFAFDHGIDLNYTMFDLISDNNYTGPSGYMGPADDLEDWQQEADEEGGFDLTSIGNHYVSIGYSLGVSMTMNPVAQLRLTGYAHFVPSFAAHISGMNINIGFMPYLKYGCELSYSWFGVGVEWGTGVSKMSDMMAKLIAEGAEYSTPKTKFYSNYTKFYISFRLGKVKK